MRRLNLQLFAESAESQEQVTDETKNLTAEEMKQQLAQLKAEQTRLQRRADALASDNARKTKLIRERMTAEELERAKEAERDEQFKALERKLTVMKTISVCMDALEMNQATAQRYAEAKVSGDTAMEAKILKQHIQSIKTNAMQGFLKGRPSVNAGHGNAETESKAVQLIRSLPVYSTEIDESILKQYM